MRRGEGTAWWQLGRQRCRRQGRAVQHAKNGTRCKRRTNRQEKQNGFSFGSYNITTTRAAASAFTIIFFLGGCGKITVEHDTSSSQPERENQEIKGLNTGVLLERPQIIVCDPKLRKEAKALQSDSELRQTIKQQA